MQFVILSLMFCSKGKMKFFKVFVFKWDVECYYVGMFVVQRCCVQKCFMNGQLCVVVVIVVFGMGLDKLDVWVIIYYNFLRSFESYVQEIGCVGWDGCFLYCYVFFDLQVSVNVF